MTSNKPYLIRALYEWLLDNNATPYLMVDTSHPKVEIPPGIEKDGQVVLNIAPRAVQGLEMDNDYVAFSARFAGSPHNIYIPIAAVLAIYSMEDGEGMMFTNANEEQPEASGETATGAPAADQAQVAKKPGLKIVK